MSDQVKRKNRLAVKQTAMLSLTFFSFFLTEETKSNCTIITLFRCIPNVFSLGSKLLCCTSTVDDLQAVSLPPPANLLIHPFLLGLMSSSSAHLRSSFSLFPYLSLSVGSVSRIVLDGIASRGRRNFTQTEIMPLSHPLTACTAYIVPHQILYKFKSSAVALFRDKSQELTRASLTKTSSLKKCTPIAGVEKK